MTALSEPTDTDVMVVDAVLGALGTVLDPELDQPITELNFVRSIFIDDDGVAVHLRLPTSFCSPNFAYLMASDALDALEDIDGIGDVRVMLDDHHDSDKINAGLAAHAGYKGTFGVEAEQDLEELRLTFLRKAHTAAMERAVAKLISSGQATVEDCEHLLLRDLPTAPPSGHCCAAACSWAWVCVPTAGSSSVRTAPRCRPSRSRCDCASRDRCGSPWRQQPFLPRPAGHPLRRRRRV